MSRTKKSVSILVIVQGTMDVIEGYKKLSELLSEEYHVKLVSNRIDGKNEEKQCEDGKNEVISTKFTHVTYNADERESDQSFLQLMKNGLSPELQKLIKSNSRLQVAMAKCNSNEFMALLKSSIISKHECSFIIGEMLTNPPDLVICGVEKSEYFGLYAKHVLNIPSMLCISHDKITMRGDRRLKRWMDLENAVSLLEHPSLTLKIVPPGHEITTSLMNQILRDMPSSTYHGFGDYLNQNVADIKELLQCCHS
jgi:hypothetical protein